MITDFIVSALLACIDALLGLLPDWVLPSGQGNGGELELLGSLNRIIPIVTVINVLLLLLALRFLISTFQLAQWVYHQFWGSA